MDKDYIENTDISFTSLQRLVEALSSKGNRGNHLGDCNSLQAFHEAYSHYVGLVTPSVMERMLAEHNILWEALNKIVEVCLFADTHDNLGIPVGEIEDIVEEALYHLESKEFEEGNLVRISPYFKGKHAGHYITVTHKYEWGVEGVINFSDRSFINVSVKNHYLLPA